MQNSGGDDETAKRKRNNDSQKRSRQKRKQEDDEARRVYGRNSRRIAQLERMVDELTAELFGSHDGSKRSASDSSSRNGNKSGR